MLTYKQAQTVKQTISETTHSLVVEKMARGAYRVRAVDRATGYPLTVYDFEAWSERRAENAYMAALDAQETHTVTPSALAAALGIQ